MNGRDTSVYAPDHLNEWGVLRRRRARLPSTKSRPAIGSIIGLLRRAISAQSQGLVDLSVLGGPSRRLYGEAHLLLRSLSFFVLIQL